MIILLHSELLHKPNAQYYIHFNNDHNNVGMCRENIIFTRAVITQKEEKRKIAHH
jgi:hypothetical protein